MNEMALEFLTVFVFLVDQFRTCCATFKEELLLRILMTIAVWALPKLIIAIVVFDQDIFKSSSYDSVLDIYR